MDKIDVISNKLMIIIGILMYLLGTIGNLLSICVFLIWSRSNRSSCHRRRSNSSLYLLVSSISNIIVIFYPLLTRIMVDGYKYFIKKETTFIICKFRYYILHTFDLISLTCICLATFDRYLITSRKARLRKLSLTRKKSELLILVVIFVSLLHSIPIIIYYDVSNNGYCTILSIYYLYYYLYIFQIFLHGLIPILFLSIFGTLTFKQMKLINYKNIHFDKQLSRMLFLISLAIILSSIPYCIEQCYYVLFNQNNRNIHSFKYLYHVTCSILFYTNPVFSFYIYYVSTKNFRKQVHKIIFCKQSFSNLLDYRTKNINNQRQSIQQALL